MNAPLSPEEMARQMGVKVEVIKPKSDFRFVLEMASDIEITGGAEWAVEDLLPLRGLAAIYGAPGCGKSFLALDVAMHIATGRDWFGRQVTPGAVVYLAAEAGAGFRKRIVACMRGHDFTGRIPLAMVATAPNLGTTKDGNEAGRLIAEIRAQAPRLGQPIRAIVIDTLARTMFGADENSAADMGAFVANAGAVAEAFNCLVIAVHHSGKDEERGMRGSSALHGACDAEWQVKSLGDTKTVLLAKNKEGEDGLTWSFRLATETVFDGGAKQGAKHIENVSLLASSKPITSCYVEPQTEPKHSETLRTRRPLKGVKRLVLDAVREAIIEHGEYPPISPDLPEGVRCAKRKDIKDVALAKGVGDPDKPDSVRAILSARLSELAGDGYLGIWGEYVWLAS